MGDLLIRNVPEGVIAALEVKASRLGLSRTEYPRRRIAADASGHDGRAAFRSPHQPYSLSNTPRLRSRIGRWGCNSCWRTAAVTGRLRFRTSSIAATAELSGLTVLHVDKNFEVIAEVTGQSIEYASGPR